MTPTSSPFLPPVVRALLVRWFVQYNPLFTASALCMLGGILALSDAMGVDLQLTAGLALLLDLYVWLLLGAAALLYRRLLRRRPAAILGIIAMAFLGDPTLQCAALATSGLHSMLAFWMISFMLKLGALAYAFRLRVAPGAYFVVGSGAAIAAMMPMLRVSPDLSESSLAAPVLAVCVFLVGLLTRTLPLTIEFRLAMTPEQDAMFRRIVKGAWGIWCACAAYHAWNAMLSMGLSSMLPTFGSLALLCAVRTTDEKLVWAWCGAALMFFAPVPPYGVGIGLVVTSCALVLASARHPARLLTGAVLGAHAACLTFGVPPTSLLLVSSSLGLLWVLFQRRGLSALPALLWLWLPVAKDHGLSAATLSGASVGGALVVAGFVLLVLGVVVHGFKGALESSAAHGADDISATTPTTPAAAMARSG